MPFRGYLSAPAFGPDDDKATCGCCLLCLAGGVGGAMFLAAAFAVDVSLGVVFLLAAVLFYSSRCALHAMKTCLLARRVCPSSTRLYTEEPAVWNVIREMVLIRDGRRCINCGISPQRESLHVHHIKPLSEGGTNQWCNLVTLCKKCHQAAHPGLSLDWRGR